MNRLLVILLSAFDAIVAAAVGVAAALAPLTLLWVFALGQGTDWATLWPASATVWQLGHLVPVSMALPEQYVVDAGISTDAARFWITLAPLAFAAFTAIFAARSGSAAASGAWITGLLSGALVFATLTTAVALTARNGIGAIHLWQAVLFPALVFAFPALLGAVVTAWTEGDGGMVDRIHDRVDALHGDWAAVPALIVRGGAIAVVGFVGLGALVTAFAVLVGGGQVVALFEAGDVDALGATVITLAQLAYLPTLVIWGGAFVAGPGFAVGIGTAVSPAGTQLGVVPGIPVLGAIPQSVSPWLLLLALMPVAVGAFAGWVARSRLATSADRVEHTDRPFDDDEAVSEESAGARAVIALGIAVVAAAGSGLLALFASGSIGPDRMTELGPHAGAVALSVGLEVLVGAAILLLSPRRRRVAPADGVHDEPHANEPSKDQPWTTSLDTSVDPDVTAPVDARFAPSPPVD